MMRRAFDEVVVVDRALSLFWRLGYDACSVSALVEATGLGRQSLYATFGDKQGLFLAVLARYDELVQRELAPLRAEGAGIPDLRRFMQRSLHEYAERDTGACLAVKTALGPAVTDPRIRAAVERTGKAVRDTFARVLQAESSAGSLPGGSEPRTLAAYLYGVLTGVSALRCLGGSERQASAVLDHAFGSLSTPAAPRK